MDTEGREEWGLYGVWWEEGCFRVLMGNCGVMQDVRWEAVQHTRGANQSCVSHGLVHPTSTLRQGLFYHSVMQLSLVMCMG
jgi:hypothetical protein